METQTPALSADALDKHEPVYGLPKKLTLGGAALQRCDKALLLRAGFRR
jgi:hypothetical protein